MKILHIIAPDAVQEMRNRFADLVCALASIDIVQHVIMYPDEGLEQRFKALDIPYIVQKFSGLFDLRTQQAAQKVINSFTPHIIQMHSPGAVDLAMKLQSKALRIGFTDDQSADDEAQYQSALAASDILLAVGYPQPDTPLDYDILTIPPLVQDLAKDEAQKEESADDQLLIGTMIDLIPQYNLETIFHAIREIPHLGFHICGEGPLKGKLKSTARRQAVHDRVEFLDTATDKNDFLRSLDICVIPFRQTGTDRLTLEAWSSGACVLSGMPPERSPITPEQDGWLVENNDVLQWRAQLSKLLENPALREKTAKAGQEKYRESFAAKRLIYSYLQAYETALRLKA